MNLATKISNGVSQTGVSSRFSSLLSAQSAIFLHPPPFSSATLFLPPSGPATGSLNGLNPKSKFLAFKLRHSQSLGGKSIKIRSLDLTAITTEIGETEIISHDQKNIRLFRPMREQPRKQKENQWQGFHSEMESLGEMGRQFQTIVRCGRRRKTSSRDRFLQDCTMGARAKAELFHRN